MAIRRVHNDCLYIFMSLHCLEPPMIVPRPLIQRQYEYMVGANLIRSAILSSCFDVGRP